MKRLAAVLVLLTAALLASEAAAARTVRYDFMKSLRAMGGSFTIPPEWDGIWQTVDSTYDCMDVFQDAGSGEDTLCAGQTVYQDDPSNPFPFSCTGTANGSTIDVTCISSGEIFTDCFIEFTIHIQATLSGSSFHSVTTTTQTYTGTGEGCEFFQDQCTKIVSDGTRTGPAPASYCATPTRRETWGRLKLRYR